MPYWHGKHYWGWVPLHDGSRKRVSLGTTDKVTARDIEALMRNLAGRREWVLIDAVATGHCTAGEIYDHAKVGPEGLDLLKAKLSDIDLNQFVDPWQQWARRRASPTTTERYLVQLRSLIPEGEPYPRSGFTRKAINEALARLSVSGSTARRYHAAWSSFAKYLVEIEVIDTNPLRAVRPPRNNPARELYISLDDSIRYVEATPEPYRSLAALREGAGVEISAALRVYRRDVDLEAQTVHVRGTKNDARSRPVFVENWAWPFIVAATKGKLPGSPLFVGPDSRVATYYGARVAHKAAVAAAQLPSGYTMHDARHSFAVRCMKAGVEPQAIAGNLGHRDASMVLKVYGRYRLTASDFRRLQTGTGGR